MAIAQEVAFLGANHKDEPRSLPDGVGVVSMNQKPAVRGVFEPWRSPATISGPVIPAGRQTIYRMGRDTTSKTDFWLSWTAIVHAIRAFDTSDPTERTYYTDGSAPKWTDNIQALATTPYPTAARDLGVPAPTVAPTVTLNTDGSTGDARQLYYVYTRVNDIGWESMPSPPTLAASAMPGAIFDLSYSEAVPAGNYGVTKVRWYRQQVATGSTVAEYYFIREYAIGDSGQQDDGRALGEQLQTEGWSMLDSTATWLTLCWNQFAAAIVDKSVRTCVPNFIYAWPRVNGYEYRLPSTPVALAAYAQQLVAFTTDGAYVFTGSDPDALDQRFVELPVIVSPRSLVVGDSWCMWAASDGLWTRAADGTISNMVGKCLTPEQWRAMVPSTIAGYRFDLGERPLYVGFYNDGTLKGFVVDPTNDLGFYPLETGYTAGFYDPLLRTLFVLDGSTLKEWDAGASFMTASWTGKLHRQSEDSEAEWLEVLASGSATVKVHTNDPDATDDTAPLIQRFNRSITRGQYRMPDGTVGRDFQVQISTQGQVQGLVIE